MATRKKSKTRASASRKGGSRKSTTHRDPADEHAATELVMFIENTSDLSPDGPSGQGRSVLLNALRKWRKGTYDPVLGVRLFEYLAEAGAKRYAKEFDSEKNWSTIFNPATRHEAARQLEESFRSSVESGEYDHVNTRLGLHEGPSEARRRPSRNPPASYPYGSSRSGQYILSRDGSEIMRGSEQEIWRWMHSNLGYSIDHALKYEGYKIVPTGNVDEVEEDRPRMGRR